MPVKKLKADLPSISVIFAILALTPFCHAVDAAAQKQGGLSATARPQDRNKQRQEIIRKREEERRKIAEANRIRDEKLNAARTRVEAAINQMFCRCKSGSDSSFSRSGDGRWMVELKGLRLYSGGAYTEPSAADAMNGYEFRGVYSLQADYYRMYPGTGGASGWGPWQQGMFARISFSINKRFGQWEQVKVDASGGPIYREIPVAPTPREVAVLEPADNTGASAASLNALAENEVRNYFERMFVKCGQARYAVHLNIMKLSGYRDLSYSIEGYKFEDLSYELEADNLTLDDRQQGIAWKGEMRLNFERGYSFDDTEYVSHNEKYLPSSSILKPVISVQQINGRWKFSGVMFKISRSLKYSDNLCVPTCDLFQMDSRTGSRSESRFLPLSKYVTENYFSAADNFCPGVLKAAVQDKRALDDGR